MNSDSRDSVKDASAVVTAADIRTARDRLESVVHRTPLDSSTTLATECDAAGVHLKLENMQRTGSFKIRGAYNKLSQLDTETADNGVVAASAGNHAQGVALAGQLLDVDSTIVVPEITPAVKIEATRGYGAEVIVEGDIYEDSYERALDLTDERGAEFVHPFDDEAIIAGQGTVGFELAEQCPNVDTVLVSIGGGGLISGIATALEAYDPSVRVIGVQPAGAAHAKPSLEADEIHRLDDIDTVAEGIADARLLDRTFAVIRERVDDVVSVSDTDLAAATTLLAERAKTVVEPAGAAPVAALLSGAVDVAGEQVVAVVSGGNVNLTDHAALTRVGLEARGRYATARLLVDGWPTSLGPLTETIADEGAELVELERVERTAADPPNRTPVEVGIAGSSPVHLAGVLDALNEGTNVRVQSSNVEQK
ncbi:threonine ammonia-lyase [Haladaptatus sp. DYSN1]|uniref:threonine ammonia-lyase n=1 Tax=unclassified Haladaptatus TaxID=2622732 RepID=UPI002406E5A7|nr:threonine ammonia-lyase [Haladaptatus sp. DYSN1]